MSQDVPHSIDDIYFGEDQVDENIIPQLAAGLSVWVEVEMAARDLLQGLDG